MTSKNRRDRERDQTRGKIINAARLLFAAEGYEAVSMRRIADAIEYSPTAIYVHFKDKRDLFAAVCTEDFAALAGSVREIAAVADPVERIRQLGLAYCRFGLANPYHYRLMFMPPMELTQEVADARPEKGNPDADAWTMCRLAVQAAADAGLLQPAFRDVELAAQTFWAGMHGVVSLQIIKGPDAWVDWTPINQRIEAMTDALIRGICIEKAPARKRGKP